MVAAAREKTGILRGQCKGVARRILASFVGIWASSDAAWASTLAFEDALSGSSASLDEN